MRPSLHRAAIIPWGLIVVASLPEAASAHAFPQRHDLPLPLAWYLAGAAAAVVVSFLFAARRMRAGSARGVLARLALPAPLAGAVERTGAVLGVAVLLLLLVAGFLGEQEHWARNPLPIMVWVGFWVGLFLACALLGDVWRLINPWAAMGRWLRPEHGGTGGACEAVPAWPAVGLFAVYAWLELVWPHNAHPRDLAMVIVVYSVFTLTAMAALGTERWLARGEVFTVLFGLLARFAPLTVERRGGRPVLVVRRFGAGLTEGAPLPASSAALVLLLLATVTFDGFSETGPWSRISGWIVGWLYGIGVVQALGYVAAGAIARTAGLMLTPVLVAAVYLLAMRVVARREKRPWGETARAYAPTLLPIAIGYHVAHYFSSRLMHGPLLLGAISDPFAYGWNLFGTVGYQVDITRVGMRLIWMVALGGIVGGHVAAVLAAHRLALARQGAPADAVRAQIPLMILMTVYTMASLWIMAQPIVEH